MDTNKTIEEERIEFGKVIKAAREEAGLSLRALGEILGRNPSTILNYERGSVKINETTKQKLLKALNLPHDVTTIINTTIDRSKSIIKLFLKLNGIEVVRATPSSEIEIPISWSNKYEELYAIYIEDNLITSDIPARSNLIVAKNIAPQKSNLVHFSHNGTETIGRYVEGKDMICIDPDIDLSTDNEIESICIDKSDDYEMMSFHIFGTVIGYISDINTRP
jgi:transcriptional regulator with XRE-family HTH domain